jgi:hypothetical protein
VGNAFALSTFPQARRRADLGDVFVLPAGLLPEGPLLVVSAKTSLAVKDRMAAVGELEAWSKVGYLDRSARCIAVGIVPHAAVRGVVEKMIGSARGVITNGKGWGRADRKFCEE